MVSSLPTGGCLLVMDPGDRKQAKFMRGVARAFHKAGREVMILAAGETSWTDAREVL